MDDGPTRDGLVLINVDNQKVTMTIAPVEPADAVDDAELAVAAAGGNQLAFSAIYDRYADRLYDFCVGMLGDGDAAADCVQDVFVTAATKLVQLHDPNRLRSWPYAIARHEALARVRPTLSRGGRRPRSTTAKDPLRLHYRLHRCVTCERRSSRPWCADVHVVVHVHFDLHDDADQ
jgi:hypothetical protein